VRSKRLNICLHDIVETAQDVRSVYDLTKAQLKELLDLLQVMRSQKVIDSYEIFFDDGYQSVWGVVRDGGFGIENKDIHLAIITDHIDEPGKLTSGQIVRLAERGFSIDSHGVSHAALAIFIEDALQSSPRSGSYKNSPYGKSRVLSVQQIQYQLIESSRSIASITGCEPCSFVLPYGLYNEHVVYSIANTRYRRVYSCDAAFDSGQMLAPRLLVTQENINQLESIIIKLPQYPKLLTNSKREES